MTQDDAGAAVEVETADGRYTLQCDWLIVADGARSPIRRALGLDIEGKVFQDRFLIADVVLDGEPFPADRTERRFWFDPPFHPGQSALMHREADNVWRIDFQLGWDADPEAEKQPERVTPRIRAVLDSQGFAHIGFELEWVSVYTFQCRRMASFRHGRLLFVGDAAHQVSPFGARGANSGVQDTDNLLWKLQLVIQGTAPASLLDSYSAERTFAADENLLNSTRATDFMTPKSRAAKVLRDAVLSLAEELPMGRALVNSGRLSVPALLTASSLNTPDSERLRGLDGARRAAGRCAGARRRPAAGWLLPHTGHGFVLMLFGAPRRGAARRARRAGARRDPGAAAGRAAAGRARPARPAVAGRHRRLVATPLRRPGPAPPTSSGPTSMWPHAGAASTPARCAPRWRVPPGRRRQR